MEVEKIYFDMDGVHADFERGVKEISGLMSPSQNANHHKAGDDEMWARIKACSHFYDKLELMSGAKDMFDAVYGKYGAKCEILTGIPKSRREIADAAEEIADEEITDVAEEIADEEIIEEAEETEEPAEESAKEATDVIEDALTEETQIPASEEETDDKIEEIA